MGSNDARISAATSRWCCSLARYITLWLIFISADKNLSESDELNALNILAALRLLIFDRSISPATYFVMVGTLVRRYFFLNTTSILLLIIY